MGVAGVKVQLGAGTRPIPGFVNIDPRPLPGVTPGHAHQIPALAGGVDLLFANAVFEHLYVAQLILAIHEWRRVLHPDGAAVIIGIPDFETIVRVYLDRKPGITNPTFDILEVYRYTHGFPEAGCPVDWRRWSPADHLNDAPPEWLPQLHKGLFDEIWLRELFTRGGLCPTIFRYCYPGETYGLNLGVVAGHRQPRLDVLDDIPGIDSFMVADTVTVLNG